MNESAPVSLPSDVRAVTDGGRWEPVGSGDRSHVWQVSFDDGRNRLAVKMAARSDETGEVKLAERVGLVQAEAERLAWLADHLGGRGLRAPEVVFSSEPDDPDPILVTEWLDGTVDPRFLRSPELAVEGFARALASLHGASRRIDLDACPFDASIEARLEAAEVRVAAGLVDTSSSQDPYSRYRPEHLLDRARSMADAAKEPSADDRVLVHGDACVTNVVFDPAYGAVVGAVDWSHAGVGDRMSDLAVTARSLARNLSGEVLPDFFDAYGLREPDLLRIELYTLLEELL